MLDVWGEAPRTRRGDAEHRRMPWCRPCKTWIDRDINAALNLSERGLARFAGSLPRPESLAASVFAGWGERAGRWSGEGEPGEDVDPQGRCQQVSCRHEPMGRQNPRPSPPPSERKHGPSPHPHPPARGPSPPPSERKCHPHPPFPVRLASASPGACGNPSRTLTPLTPRFDRGPPPPSPPDGGPSPLPPPIPLR
jgi:hypothetical protein